MCVEFCGTQDGEEPITTLAQAQECAEKGAAFLTEQFGNEEWALRVNTSILIMSDTRLCVIGQVYRNETGIRWVDFVADRPTSWLIEHGFDSANRDGYGLLQKAWVDLIDGMIMSD